MLQQTRVEAVIEPWGRFLAAFPSLAALASADETDVLAQWSGLGYYRRARSLHAGAAFVMEKHGGALPRTRAELEAVPGIGAYTAGALLSMAFGLREAAVDANVSRVVARLLALEDARSPAGRAEVARFASALADCERPGDVNEALMDLGSGVCTARAARCDDCPLAAPCLARRSGAALRFGAPVPRRPPRVVEVACAVVDGGCGVLFFQRSRDEALLGGLWDLPTVETGAERNTQAALAEEIRSRSGLAVELKGPIAVVRHDIVGRKISATIYEAALEAGRGVRLPADVRFLEPCDYAGVGLPALPLRILRVWLRAASPQSS